MEYRVFFKKDLFGNEIKKDILLKDRFIVPPFSVFDTKQGYWKERKKIWLNLMEEKGQSRENKLSTFKLSALYHVSDTYCLNRNAVSILNPVIVEVLLYWFCVEGGKVFDMFAGDLSVGFVSVYKKHEFIGVELREEQCDENRKRIKKHGLKAIYINDDGCNIDKYINLNSQDLLFSCPPYYNLEVYSNLKEDCSNQEKYKDYLKIIDLAFTNGIKCLKNNRFACIIISDIRDKNSNYINIIGDIKNIFKKNGMNLYNEIILLDPLATAPARARPYMKNRKVVKVHQNILVFYKGDNKQIKNNFKELKEYEGNFYEE